MNVKLIIAGLLCILFGIFNFFGLLGVLLLFVLGKSTAYLIISGFLMLIFGVAYFITGITLFLKKKIAYRLGILVPILVIIRTILDVTIVLLFPGVWSAELMQTFNEAVIITIFSTIFDFIIIALVYASKKELLKT